MNLPESLSSENQLRYSRQISVAEIGGAGQARLLSSKVLVIGCGALGSMVAMQLAGAGVGKIGIADFDTIDISNLQRQFFFNSSDAGKEKVKVLKDRILDLNPDIKVDTFSCLITIKKAEEIFGAYDFIVDATDNPDSKKIIGEISQKLSKPCCIGGVSGFHGQVMTHLAGDARFEDFFGLISADGFMPCSIGGVIGPAAAVCASIQAAETIKYLIGSEHLLSGRLLTFDLLNNLFKIFRFSKS